MRRSVGGAGTAAVRRADLPAPSAATAAMAALLAAALCALVAGGAAAQQTGASGESAAAPRPAGPPPQLFQPSDQCVACHNGLVTPSGEDVSLGVDWGATMMANAARDPYWQATIRREILDHPEASEAIQAECSTCHMPMASYEARAAGGRGRVFGHLPIGVAGAVATRADLLAADGVSCTTCHQIRDEGLGTRESFVGGFRVDEQAPLDRREIFGPFQVDSGRTTLMHSATGFRPTQATHLSSSEMCATCHTLYTHARDDEGAVVGELPEQVPYLEWKHSAYPAEEASCQSCHMPVVEDSVAVSSVLGRPRAGVNRHVFRGGNFLVLRMLARYGAELGVAARPRELAAAARETEEHLAARSATLSVDARVAEDGRLRAEVAIENLAGHKLPTAYPSRRVWLHVTVRDAAGATVFESGALEPGGWIRGNDNDDDPTELEPHHEEITRPGQVQIFEAVMADHRGELTTGVTSGIRYVKDNRILPRGFDKETAEEDIAVQGEASADADFVGGGDRVRYVVDPGGAAGPFRVEAELWYQPIAYRWAQNLRTQDAPEIHRFVRYYQEMAGGTATLLARASSRTP